MIDEASQQTIQSIKASADLRTQMQQRAQTEADPAAVEQELENLHIAYQNSVRSNGRSQPGL